MSQKLLDPKKIPHSKFPYESIVLPVHKKKTAKSMIFKGRASDLIYGTYDVILKINARKEWVMDFNFPSRFINGSPERYTGFVTNLGGTLISPHGHDTITFYSGNFDTVLCSASKTHTIHLEFEQAFYGYVEENYGV